ncbi:hypothetical protein [Chitinophaga pinensis]|uniref:Uncharacterized protein n=1 Tax=Chitinophaga pinensis (strain ATCC 43595 / DSM 2588 / LMG 13176 / NBRC 15968 / NCIMB 11800 / UQM 2034) TaxID=485918 RepID=A0A979GBT0_CHIPD|nr:hypothetical protein [Chitinophaga pinensis]ACU64561.1 hypothetical protein Cpin_7160 [Chitinophaga pinensis DSM 2588]
MAKQTSIIQFTGRLGNMIGYYRKGDYFLRSTPDTVRQTAATQRAAQRFGMASKKGAFIRHAIYAALDVHCDSSHVNRLTKLLIPAAGNHINVIKGFRFNQHAGIDHFFPVAPFFSADNVLHIPAQTLRHYKGITMLEVKMIATRIDCKTHRIMGTQTTAFSIDATATFGGLMHPVAIPGTGTLIVTLQIRAFNGTSIIANKQHLVADIIAIQKPQIQETVCTSPATKTIIMHHEEQVQLHTPHYRLLLTFIQRE